MNCIDNTSARAVAPRRVPRLALLATVAALGLAGCGGGGHKTTAAQTSPATTASTTSDPATTHTTTAASKHADKRAAARRADPPAAATPAPAAAPSTVPSNPTVVDPNNTHPTAPGPKPVACLRAAGLTRARPAREPGAWQANEGTTSNLDVNHEVFVDGPYRSHAAAASAAASLQGVEIATSGGVYEVSATLVSHLNRPVAAAARCLAGAAPGGSKGSRSAGAKAKSSAHLAF